MLLGWFCLLTLYPFVSAASDTGTVDYLHLLAEDREVDDAATGEVLDVAIPAVLTPRHLSSAALLPGSTQSGQR